MVKIPEIIVGVICILVSITFLYFRNTLKKIFCIDRLKKEEWGDDYLKIEVYIGFYGSLALIFGFGILMLLLGLK